MEGHGPLLGGFSCQGAGCGVFDSSSHDTDDIVLNQAAIEPYAHETSEQDGAGETHQADLSKEPARKILRSISVIQRPGFFGFLSYATPEFAVYRG